ncbi:hypothetical protein [uncultured Psychrobacter sp.]
MYENQTRTVSIDDAIIVMIECTDIKIFSLRGCITYSRVVEN